MKIHNSKRQTVFDKLQLKIKHEIVMEVARATSKTYNSLKYQVLANQATAYVLEQYNLENNGEYVDYVNGLKLLSESNPERKHDVKEYLKSLKG